MSLDVELQKKNANIAVLLNSAIMVGRYRGEEIWNEVEKLIDEVPNDTLVLIDFREAMPLQYTFSQYAFGPLLQDLNSGRWSRKYVIFQMC